MSRIELHGELHRLAGYELPQQLAELKDPPEELWVLGNPGAFDTPTIAMVGARRCTPYGEACASKFAALAVGKGYTVVSGGARGIDAAAHWAAVDNGGRTVAVLAGGIDWCYPNDNAALFQRIVDGGGAIASEQQMGVEPRPYMFLKRNRIIAGLSQAMLVAECKVPSGTFTACDSMLSLNRPLLAIPGSVFSEHSSGCNHLIAERLARAVHDEDSFGRWL